MAQAGGIVFRGIAGDVVGIDDVAARLGAEGIVVFSGAHRDLLADCLESWTVPRAHPHADSRAFTVIEPRSSAVGPGDRGFSCSGITPHTDRALVPDPPALAALLMERPAPDGGHSLLVDPGPDRIFRLLTGTGPAAHRLCLHAADGTCRPVVDAAHGLMRVRFRDDDVAWPRPAGMRARALLARLRALSIRPLTLRLGAGEGYLLHNHRVLHGRTGFSGHRTAVRLLADLRPEHRFGWLNDGFASGRRERN